MMFSMRKKLIAATDLGRTLIHIFDFIYKQTVLGSNYLTKPFAWDHIFGPTTHIQNRHPKVTLTERTGRLLKG